MPIQRCKSNGKIGWRWGKSGKCYVGPGGKAKAHRQERAIRASGWTENQRRKTTARNPLKADPTRTATLRRVFQRDMRVRFDAAKAAIVKLIVEADAFDLGDRPSSPFTRNMIVRLPPVERFKFKTAASKLDEFRKWLEEMFTEAVTGTDDAAVWRKYVEEGYRKGAGRAFDDVRVKARAAAGAGEQLAFYEGTKEQFLRHSFARPVATRKVELLAGRVFTELKGVTNRMAQTLTRLLADGMVQGDGPITVARRMRKEMDIGKRRAETIARTETIRAHAEGALDSLEELGVTEVGVMVEWSTAGDTRVCERCAPLEGIVMKLDEMRGMIPRHPNCRCTPIPVDIDEPPGKTLVDFPEKLGGRQQIKQKRSHAEIRKAIDKSIAAEGSKKRSLAEKKRRSTWVGADQRIAKKRPKSIL